MTYSTAFAQDGARLLSRPVRVLWDGWETDTMRLQQGGWEINAEQDISRHTVRLLMRNQRNQMFALTNEAPLDFFRAHSDPRIVEALTFQIVHMAGHMTIQAMMNPMAFKPIDAKPQIIMATPKNIEDFDIFATPLVRTKEIIVAEPSVADLLEQIIAKQDPARKAYFTKKVHEGRQPGAEVFAGPRQKFHAQIISIQEAA